MANNILERRNGESDLAYHKRIIYGKLVDKTLAEYDYSELSVPMYGRPLSTDVARRMAYGSKETLELIDAERVSGVQEDSVLSEIDIKMAEIKKERQKLSDQRREYNKILSLEARDEHLQDVLISAANSLSDTLGQLYSHSSCNYISCSDTEAVLVFSDWHYGMKASNVFNEFNISICKERVQSIVEQAAERLKLHGCRKLHVAILGDCFHGAIHTSARVASEELVCDQIMQVSEVLAQSIEYLSQFVEDTIVYATYGNHARTVQNKNDSIHRDNLERLVPWWLKQRLSAYNNIHIEEDSGSEFLFINACGYEGCASHGDNDSVKSSPRLLATLFSKKLGKDISFVLLGDKHHRDGFEELGIDAYLCGSLCGSDDYANNKRLYSTPSQLMLIFNRYGVDAEYRLKCK